MKVVRLVLVVSKADPVDRPVVELEQTKTIPSHFLLAPSLVHPSSLPCVITTEHATIISRQITVNSVPSKDGQP